MLTGAESK